MAETSLHFPLSKEKTIQNRNLKRGMDCLSQIHERPNGGRRSSLSQDPCQHLQTDLSYMHSILYKTRPILIMALYDDIVLSKDGFKTQT